MQVIRELLTSSGNIAKKYNQLLDATGGRFNVFQVIGLTTNETKVHSAFINELLDCKGSHGLKDGPLEAFVKLLIGKDYTFERQTSRATTEYYIGPVTDTTGGYLDILVSNGENEAIIIENKINAGDQEHQMLRYYNHSKVYSKSKLIYLSLDGKEPSDYSTAEEQFDYLTISYKTDIIEWLIECKQMAVDFPLVREAITHYINLIKHLTDTSIMAEKKKEIIDIVTSSPEYTKNAFELSRSLVDVKIKTQWQFWKKLEEALKAKGVKLIDTDDTKSIKHWKIKGYYEKQRNRNVNYGLWSEIYSKDGITLHWGAEVNVNFYTGFTVEKDGVGGISNNVDMETFRKIVHDCDNRYDLTSPYWLGWIYSSPQLDFRTFNTEDIYSLVDEVTLEKVTADIAEKAASDIEYILEALNKEDA